MSKTHLSWSIDLSHLSNFCWSILRLSSFSLALSVFFCQLKLVLLITFFFGHLLLCGLLVDFLSKDFGYLNTGHFFRPELDVAHLLTLNNELLDRNEFRNNESQVFDKLGDSSLVLEPFGALSHSFAHFTKLNGLLLFGLKLNSEHLLQT